MNKKEVINLLDSFLPKLYQFSYILIPEELQAHQLVIDALTVFSIREKSFIYSRLINQPINELDTDLKKEVYQKIYGIIFDVGKKRFTQLKDVMQARLDSDRFYQLPYQERAVIYLGHKERCSVEEIEQATKLGRYEVLSKLHYGRSWIREEQTMEEEAR